jgi:hypothetical protein
MQSPSRRVTLSVLTLITTTNLCYPTRFRWIMPSKLFNISLPIIDDTSRSLLNCPDADQGIQNTAQPTSPRLSNIGASKQSKFTFMKFSPYRFVLLTCFEKCRTEYGQKTIDAALGSHSELVWEAIAFFQPYQIDTTFSVDQAYAHLHTDLEGGPMNQNMQAWAAVMSMFWRNQRGWQKAELVATCENWSIQSKS